jgi:hypothetical protein
MKQAATISLIAFAGLAGFWMGRSTAPSLSLPVELTSIGRELPPPGVRSMELARMKRVAVRVASDDMVTGARNNTESTVRNQLAQGGLAVVPETEEHDALIQVRIEGYHFSAFDEYGAGSEIHVVEVHAVEVDGVIRMIPHDIWQSDAVRLARRERIDAEAVALSEELCQHLVAAFNRAKAAEIEKK